MTKCYNRKALHWAYEGDFDKGSPIAIIMCDLNGLKRINDTKGHEAGDRYLCDAAEGMMSCFGEKQVYRVGGDEFIIVLLDILRRLVFLLEWHIAIMQRNRLKIYCGMQIRRCM